MPLKFGSSVMRRAISASSMPSRSARARSSTTVSAINWASDLPVEPERPRLIRQDRTAEVAAELLQPVLIELAELLDADFGAADLGHGRLAETAENVADAPDRRS